MFSDNLTLRWVYSWLLYEIFYVNLMSQALVLLTSQSARARASWSVNSEIRNASRGSPRAYEREECFQLTHASVSYDQRTSNRKVSGSCWNAGRLAGRSRHCLEPSISILYFLSTEHLIYTWELLRASSLTRIAIINNKKYH